MTSPNPIQIILSQHAEEASFKWLLRSGATHAPHYSLNSLAKLDDMVDAHIDGLRIAGDAGWEICRQELTWQEPGELFAAAFLAFESGIDERILIVTESAIESDDAALGLASALGWLTILKAQPHISALLGSEEPILRHLGLAAAAIHRENPGQNLESALNAPDQVTTPRALRATGELGRHDLLQNCRDHLTSDEKITRFWATWASLLLGDPGATNGLVETATEDDSHSEMACTTAARFMNPGQVLYWHQQLAAQNGQLRLASLAAGAAGDPQLIPWLIETMTIDELARTAGEAFTFITGLDLADLDLDRDQPEDFESGPTEESEDDNVAMDPDENLPWPDPELISAWWAKNKGRFKSGTRYLVGEPISEKHLQNVLRTGLQRQRAAAALELVRLNPGTPLFEVRARGDRQKKILGIK